MHIRPLLHAGRAGKLHIAICGRINRVVGTPDGTRRLTGIWIRPLPYHAHVPISHRPFQALILSFAQIHRELIRLHTKPGIEHLHVTGKNANILV